MRDTEGSSKRQRGSDAVHNELSSQNELNTSKPSALFEPKTRSWTLSMAVPGSLIENTKSFEQKTLLSASMARAAAVFCVDEIVVYDDDPSSIPAYLAQYAGKHSKKTKAELQALVNPADEGYHNPDQFLFHLLSYLECPPFLRVPLIEHHPNLSKAGILPSLDIPHHLRQHDWCQYREGMVTGGEIVEESKSKSKGKAEKAIYHYVECGLPFPIKARAPATVPHKARVTIRFSSPNPPPSWPHISRQECEELEVDIVAPEAPREEGGFYWGYTVRRAASLSAVFTDSAFEGGYDCSIGTSERGIPLTSLLPTSASTASSTETSLPPTSLPTAFHHMLVVFGGREGLEPAVISDPQLRAAGLTKETTNTLFDYWVNLVPGQGSRTIRTEEAVWVGLMGLRPYLENLVEEDQGASDDDSTFG
ncbi:DUF171-domain-containing protein [Pleomassaria siparia CBS 279.74]|uniref:DUF171-domain-containing protein n=1 Tax=Pleomassaria siparia CBS 279.74 TaxID=1314801 RepID=A0A6G1JUE3_9PLEO|nr:DUF171-domain-containing protein [Pleomassaria siparia CBS 279.74]